MFICKVGRKIGALPTYKIHKDDDDERLGRVISLLISLFGLVWFRLGCLCKMQIGVILYIIYLSTHGLI